MNREEVVEEAAKAILASEGIEPEEDGSYWGEGTWPNAVRDARTALAVFEKASAATNQGREAMSDRVGTMDELVMLDSGTVLRGPYWHGEVYVKFSDVEFYAPGSETPYRASEVQARGPYTVLWPATPPENREEPNR